MWWYLLLWVLCPSSSAPSLHATEVVDEVCPLTTHQCANGKCILKESVCEGQDDCGDNSDQNIEACKCTTSEFRCGNGQCIPETWRCDNEKDCLDGSDEEDSICEKKSCGPCEFKCGNATGECIPLRWVCNRNKDCSNGVDEKVCNARCLFDQFTCGNSNCIERSSVCNGNDDCGDGSDEVNGPLKTWLSEPKNMSRCIDSEFECTDRITCLQWALVCNGFNDCPDGGDEAFEICYKHMCQQNYFQCNDLSCIPEALNCNGEKDCSDGSDEVNCTKRLCNETEFDCGDGMCIPLYKVCDKNLDCPNLPTDRCGVDECAQNNGGCTQKCVDTPVGYHCDCENGYKLINNRSCEDIDECLNPGACSQICINENGTFKCQCHSGYALVPDDPTRCKAVESNPSLLFIGGYDIRKISLNHHKMVAVVNKTLFSTSLDYNYKTGTLYWSEMIESKIYKAPINEGSQRPVVMIDQIIASGLAVDWIYNRLYWTAAGSKHIQLWDLHSGIRKILIQNLFEPLAIALNPLDGWMYWTDNGILGVEPTIGRAGMDGSHQQIIVSNDLMWPFSLTLDLVGKRLYWVDIKLHTLSSCNYDGTARRVILYSTFLLSMPSSVATFEDWVYWADWARGSIYRANKFKGNQVQEIIQSLQEVTVIQVYHPYRQPDGVNHCANAHCSHWCLPAPQINPDSPKITCSCPNGIQLLPDNQTCAEATETTDKTDSDISSSEEDWDDI